MRGFLHLVWANLAVVALLLSSAIGVYLYVANGDRIADIQRARRDTLILTCQGQNDRHDATIAKLNELIDKMPAGPRKVRAVQSRNTTIVILNVLVPKYNCEQRADFLLHPKGP